ncbi:MAG: NUDIX hydrolase [Acidimicrobiia bacterium]
MATESTLERIALELKRRTPRRAGPGSFDEEAAVSLILRPAGFGFQFLAIRRAESERDPWSGHMALPGGRRDPADASLWATAIRETREEVGLDLASAGRLLGELNVVQPTSRQIPSIAITPFVVAVSRDSTPIEGPEVERAIWVPVDALFEQRYQSNLRLAQVPDREFAAIDYEGYVIWGLTLSILGQLVEVLSRVGYADRDQA